MLYLAMGAEGIQILGYLTTFVDVAFVPSLHLVDVVHVPLHLAAGDEIGLAVLPLVGIDINGFRLGYGGGYYDRFFNQESELSRKPFIIGVGYAFQVLEVSFAEDHDLKCDSVITEKGVLKF